MDIIDVFWENVEWYENSKGLVLTQVIDMSVTRAKKTKKELDFEKSARNCRCFKR